MVKVYSDSEREELEALDPVILRSRGDIYLCLIPLDSYNSRKNAPGSRVPFFPKPRPVPTLDKAVGFYDAANIQSGAGLPRSFSGKGVVVGICDIGLDPLHPAFLDENGVSRIKRITQYIESEGVCKLLEGDEAYAEWETDTRDNHHATHVLGILAGRGAGSPYSGIAGDADIVVSTSTLTDVGLLCGVEDIIDYAKEVGKPAVINLSMGNYIGAHDGSSLFSQYLDMCADDAIIVLSAGNEGINTNCLRHAFTPSARDIAFRIGSSDWSQKTLYGMTDIWSSGNQPLSVQISVFDDQRKEIIHNYEPVVLEDGESKRYEWTNTDTDENAWGLNGYLTARGRVDRDNGRYEVALEYDYQSHIPVDGKSWARYVVGVTVKGDTGNEVEIYADGSHTRLMGMAGYPAPNSKSSISDLACGHRVVSVGMYSNRDRYPSTVINPETGVAEEVEQTHEPAPGTVEPYSGYGTLRDGRIMPLTVAPGNPILSAYSRPHMYAHQEEGYYIWNGIPWFAMGGTSMSAPYVAGYVATWLEANPKLTPEEVMALIEESNRSDYPDPDDPRNGCGFFDPLSAMKKILASSGISDSAAASLLLDANTEVDIFTVDGRKVFSGRYGQFRHSAPGLYLITTPRGTVKKILA